MRKAVWILFLALFSALFTACGFPMDWLGNRGLSSPQPQESGVTIKILAIGQGDAILIRTPEQTVVVDTGDSSEIHRLRDALKKEGVRRLDKLIITHPHRDHLGGAAEIFRLCDVKAVYDNGQPTTTNIYREYLKTIQKKKIPYQPLRDGDNLDLGGGASLHVLSPTQQMVDERGMQNGKLNLNLNSLVMRIEYGDFSMMLTGDAEIPTEEGILKRHAIGELRCRILKAGHHGSKTSSCESFLQAVDADDVLISCGENNDYHDPHPSVLNRYKAHEMNYYRTDKNGTITVRTDGKNYTVQPERGEKNETTVE